MNEANAFLGMSGTLTEPKPQQDLSLWQLRCWWPQFKAIVVLQPSNFTIRSNRAVHKELFRILFLLSTLHGETVETNNADAIGVNDSPCHTCFRWYSIFDQTKHQSISTSIFKDWDTMFTAFGKIIMLGVTLNKTV